MKSKDNKDYPNQGFSLKDQNYLRKYDNASSDPEIQMLTEEDLEEEPEQRTYFCAFCKSKLDHLQLDVDDTIWRCNNCMAYYDTNTQDMPLKDISSTGVKTYPEFQYYPVFEEDGPGMIFMQGINPDEERSIHILAQFL